MSSLTGHTIELLRVLLGSIVVVYGQEKELVATQNSHVSIRKGAQCVYFLVDPCTFVKGNGYVICHIQIGIEYLHFLLSKC